MSLASPAQLRAKGVVGMNARNHKVIQALNPRSKYPLVDDKLLTKVQARKFGVDVPHLFGVIRYQRQVRDLDSFLQGIERFVIKPTQGSGGKGILVIVRREGDRFFKPSGAELSIADIKSHVNNCLSGLYSLGGRNDAAMVENLIDFTDAFEGFSFQGVPDVRIIICQGYPIMAMMRLSTAASDGKANLHQGAVGVGIDLRTGAAIRAVQYDRRVTEHPDTGRKFSELVVPRWREHLLLAAKGLEMTGLGYMGGDIVLDKQLGPLVLELNARPGLAIQTANGLGLEERLSRALAKAAEDDPPPPPEERVDWAVAEFGSPA